MDTIGALIAVILLFLPVIVYIIRTKENDNGVILMMGVGFLIALFVVGWIAWLLFGRQNAWIGYVSVWGYGMYVAFKKFH